MTNDLMLGGVYILMAIMLVLGSLMARREPVGEAADDGARLGRDLRRRLRPLHVPRQLRLGRQRLKAEALGTPVQQGRETRIPMAIDGHFWVEARLNGHDVKFLVDSGATMTTIDRDTAERAGVEVSPRRDQYRSHRQRHHPRSRAARADELEVGGDRAQRCRACRSPTMTISMCSA